MPEQEAYTTIEKSAQAEFRDRGSKFIAYAYPMGNVGEFKERLAAIKKEHPKATHHCFAYRIGVDGNSYRASDDGEPSGTAGKPILGQIDSKGLVNVLVVVVRYFGGTLLGVPGLIRAYRSAAALALQVSPLVQRQVEKEFLVRFDYTQLNEIMNLIRQYGCRVLKQDLQLFCNMAVAVPASRLSEWRYRLGELREVELVERPVGTGEAR
jgi:uncharacterized YigZ family protein